jgi:RNA polymerase sigma factor FliA
LAPQERRVLIMYYYEECTMHEIGEVLGLSEPRVSQIHQSLLAWLREELQSRQYELVD